MGDCMPKEQFDFIKGIQDKMLDATNMTEDEAWNFAFRVWQMKDFLKEYLKEEE